MADRHEPDAIDLQILRLLQANARMTHAEIGRVVSLSAPSVLQRIRRLEDNGVIAGYRAVVDAVQLGYGVQAWVQIGLSLHEDRAIERFMKAALKLPEVLECYHVSGETDFLVKVATRSMTAYQQFVTDKLSAIKGVGKIQTCFVMGVLKTHGDLTLD